MKKLLKSVTVLVLILALLLSTAAFASRKAKVTAASLKVYNSSKTLVGTLARGTTVTVTATRGSWARFKYKGKTLYAKKSGLAVTGGYSAYTTKAASFKFVTKSSYAKGVYYKATLAAGTNVTVVGSSGSKYLVRIKSTSGKTGYGYISKSVVKAR